MINFYRRHQCWIFQLSGVAAAYLATGRGLPIWVITLIGVVFTTPAAIQDRRNRHLPKQIVSFCANCKSVRTERPQAPIRSGFIHTGVSYPREPDGDV